jgi:ATP-binding cassette subfamily B protein
VKTNSIREYRNLLPYFKPYGARYAWGFFFLLLVDAAQILVPQCIKRAVDMIAQASRPGAAAFSARPVYGLALQALALGVVISGGRFLWRYFIHGSSRRIEAEMRERMFSHLTSLSYDYYQRSKVGDLMARTTNDLGAVRNAIGMGLVALIDGTMMAAAILAVMFVENPGTAFRAVLPLPVITVTLVFFGRTLGKLFGRVQEIYSNMSDTVQETFAGIRVVKSFVKEWWFAKKFADTNEDYRKANMELIKVFGAFFPFVLLLSGITTLIVLWVGGGKVISGEMTPGDLAAFFSYLNMLVWPVLGAGFAVNALQRGAASLARITQVLTCQPSIQNPADPESPDPTHDPAIEVRHLSFRYPADDPPGTPVLHDVTMSIPRGAVFGIFGKTGSGKTTLLKTFMRMIDPPDGTVLVGSVDVRRADLAKLRGQFGVVPQDSYLFSDSIRNNIAYAAPNASDKESPETLLRQAVETASLDTDIAQMGAQWDTVVGERGLTLSGGQKQRVSIARALLGGPEILVLDDSLSAVDMETERRILTRLLELRRGRTTIIVSHRVETMRRADLVAVLEAGRLAEYGPPEELLAQEGFLAAAAKLQDGTPSRASGEQE